MATSRIYTLSLHYALPISQVVVIGLGINDFSTALNAGERWATVDALAAEYRTAYLAFIDKLRTRYGAGTQIVLTYPDLSYLTTALRSEEHTSELQSWLHLVSTLFPYTTLFRSRRLS